MVCNIGFAVVDATPKSYINFQTDPSVRNNEAYADYADYFTQASQHCPKTYTTGTMSGATWVPMTNPEMGIDLSAPSITGKIEANRAVTQVITFFVKAVNSFGTTHTQ